MMIDWQSKCGTEFVQLMEPLFERAEKNKLWFWSRYQDIWLSPTQLKTEMAGGRFRWGPSNWELRDPGERTKELENSIKATQQKRDQWLREIGAK
jgi:hypothetical protein